MSNQSYTSGLLKEMHRRIREGWTAHLASLTLIAVTYISLILQIDELGPSPLRSVILVIMCSLFAILALYGETYCEMRDSMRLRVLYFVIQIALSVCIFVLSEGAGFTSLLPLLLMGHAEGLLPRNGVIIVGMMIVLSMATYIAVMQDLVTAASVALSITAGVVFVAMFSRIAMNEQRARERSEQLTLELEQANNKLRTYAVQAEELAMTKERNRIAREIHDGMGHYLTAINVQIRAAQALLETSPERANEALDNARELSTKALAEVRSSVSALRSGPIAERSLHTAIEALVTELKTAGVDAQFEFSGEERQLPPRVTLTLYRAVQEGLTNIRKHALAQTATVNLVYIDDKRIRLEIADDGVGAEAIIGGFGLTGLRERVTLLNGDLTITTAPGVGMQLTVEVDIQ